MGIRTSIQWMIILAAIFLGVRQSFAQSGYANYLDYLYQYNGIQISERGVFKTKVPRFDDLMRDQYRYNNYEQFLDYLFSQAPSLRGNFVILHRSQSLQIASLEHPRFLLFDGGSVFAFSEHPENGLPRLEMIEVDPENYQVNPREITFSPEGLEFNAKPTSCTACHGSPAKLLWDPYDFWPGAFGSAIGDARTEEEQAAYQSLRARAKTSSLLSRLKLFEKISLGTEGNTAFTQFVAMLNSGKWMTEKFKGRDLSSIRYSLLGLMNYCFNAANSTFEDEAKKLIAFFPQGSLSPEAVQALNDIYQDTTLARKHMKDFQDRLYESSFPQGTPGRRIDHRRLENERVYISQFRWLMGLIGVDVSNLSGSFFGNDFFVSTPSNFGLDHMTSLYEVRPDLFQGLELKPRPLAGIPNSSWLQMNCEELKAQSLKTNPRFQTSTWRSFRQDEPGRPALSRCAKCHTEGLSASRAPLIPFHNAARLADRLRDPNDGLAEKILFRIQTQGPGRMPYRATPLTPEEITAIKDFIASVREKR